MVFKEKGAPAPFFLKMIIKTNKHEYLLIKELGLLVNPEIKDEFNRIIPEKLTNEKINQLIEGLKKEKSDEEIDAELCNVSNLVFGITENCNLRCSYCGYSGIYFGERTHSQKKITFGTAQKAIDLFFKYIGMDCRTLNRKIITIGFYGGEPLLEIELIGKIIDYARKRSLELGLQEIFQFDYLISTNGLLLRDDIVDFLVAKDASVAVSIDGPRETHDKFRVMVNKKGSWQVIMDNLRRFKNRYPEFFKKNVTFLCVLHPLYDGKAIDDFFLSNQQYFDLPKITFLSLKMDSLKESLETAIREEAATKKYPISRLFYKYNIANRFKKNDFKINILTPTSKLTGNCFPGGKKFLVGANGDIHVCESINQNFPIGNVFEGINYNNIRYMVLAFNEGIIKEKCWECAVWFLCNTCFVPSTYGKEFRFFCPKKDIVTGLENFLNYREDEYEKSQSCIAIDSVRDYLEFLQ